MCPSYNPASLREEKLVPAANSFITPTGQRNSTQRLRVGVGTALTGGFLFCRCHAKKGNAGEKVRRMCKYLEAASLKHAREGSWKTMKVAVVFFLMGWKWRLAS